MQLAEAQIQRYAARLYERRSDAVLLKRAEASIGEWRPVANQCHHNVTEWCARNSSYKAVRGWLYFDLSPARAAKFVAHSAVLSPNGRLYDITPTFVKATYPFIVAEEPEEQYAAMNESGVTELLHVW